MRYNSKDLIKGFVWSGLDKLGVVILQLALELILARLLLPKDYGVIGVVLVFISLAFTFSEGGFSNALIHKLDRQEIDFSTVFFANIAISFFIVITLYILAPWIENFFRIPGLKLILRVISISIVLNSAVLVHKVKLSIAMDFKSQAKFSLFSVLISGVLGVYLAYHNYGVWALVFQNIAMAALSAVFYFMGLKWFPRLQFSWLSLKNLFGFGSNILISSLLQAIYFNAYPFLIGRALSTRDLGLYAKSNQFTQMPSSVLTTMVQRVLFPFFASHQENNQKIADLNLLYTKLCCLLFFPLFFILAIVAHPLVIILFSEKWIEMTPIFIIFSIAYTLYPLIVNNMMMFQVKNKTALFLRIEIVTKIIGVVILILTYRHGLVALAYGIFAQQIIQFIITSFFVQKLLNKRISEQLKIVFPLFVFSLMLLLLSQYLLPKLTGLLLSQLAIGVAVSLFSYFIFYYLFYKEDIRNLVQIIRKK